MDFHIRSVGISVPNSGSRTAVLTMTRILRLLRPFFSGAQSRYLGTPFRVGRSTAVGDATAVDDSGKVALTARLTAYL
jgi:hypothetical protein